MGDDLKAAQRELTDEVMGRDGVTGTAIGMKGGQPCLKVYVAKKGDGSTVPKKVRGIPVDVEVTGVFKRL